MRNDIIYFDPLCRTDLGSFRTAEARPEPNEDRRVYDVAHGEIRDCDVLHERTVDGLKRETTAIFKYTIGNSDVAKSTIGFGAALDATGGPVSEDAYLPPLASA